MKLRQFIFSLRIISAGLILVLMLSVKVLQAEDTTLQLADDFNIELVRIPSGEFDMGRSSRGALIAATLSLGEQGDSATEGPMRRVVISNPFFIGKYKITCEQFCRFLNSIDNPERYVSLNHFSRIEQRDGAYSPKEGMKSHAVNVVHWEGATAFCEWLSKNSGRKVRLPTEAEWEYVARGSENRNLPWGERKISAWGSIKGASVDAFPENSTPEGVIGLLDPVVGEWCSDFYGVRYDPNETIDPKGPTKEQLPVKSDLKWLATVKGEYHVQRGRGMSTTSRGLGSRVTDSGIYGFRIVVELEEKGDAP